MYRLRLMFFGKLVLLAVVATVALHCEANGEAANNPKLEVKIYYEALCPDSVYFLTRQLQPSMMQKGRYQYADLKFVPYGKVFMYFDDKLNKTVLQCQHGKKECEKNAEQACIIENNTPKEAFDMITCLMRGFNTNLNKCSSHYRINLDAAKNCTATRSINDILKKYGDDTYSINLSFVPTISIDGIYDWDEQNEILYNFDKIFCRKYNSKFNVTLDDC